MYNRTDDRFIIEPLEGRRLLSAPFTVGGSPLVHAQDFRITTFAAGLDFPNGMTRLPDGSIIAAVNVPTDAGGYFGAAKGQIVRLVDANHDGVADGLPQVLASSLDRLTTDVRIAGKYVVVVSAGGSVSHISVFVMGRRASSPLSLVSSLTLTYPQPWKHVTYALETRPTPHQAGSFDLFFNVGSQDDATTTPASLTTSIVSADGAFSGSLHPDSIYKLTLTPSRAGVSWSNLTQVAFGLRNAAGIAVQPGSGDLYFEDNGINGGADGNANPQLSADELNVLLAAQIGVGSAPDYGFAHDYIVQATGARVGGGGVQPLAAYLPVNGALSEGPQDVVFAPTSFPAPLNHGVFAGFYGQDAGGTANTQNPVVYYDSYSGAHFDFISGGLPAIGHPVGWLSTADSLFFSDLAPANDFHTTGTGVIYQIQVKPRTYTLSGTVFNDLNSSGVRDRNEAGLAGQTVFIDYNGDGVLDAGDATAVTDRNGNYRFTVPIGDYRVSVVPPAGFHATGTGHADSSFVRTASAGMNLGLAMV